MTKDTTKRSASSSGGETSRRKEKHVSRACNGCRRRKSKCDGIQPTCGTCLAQNHQCTWTPDEDGRRPATKAQVDAMSMEIRTLKNEKEQQDATIERLKAEVRRLGGNSSPPGAALSITIPPSTPGHQRAVSEGGLSTGQYLGLPSPISHAGSSSPFTHSPVSVSSSLPSPLLPPSGQFLTVPGAALYRAATPDSGSSVFGSTTDDDEARSGIMSDSDDEGGIMAPFISTGRKLLAFNDDEEPIVVSGGSPLAFAASPPRTPARSRASSFRGSFSFPASRPSTSGGDPPMPPSAGITTGLASFRFPSVGSSPTSPFATSPPHSITGAPEHDSACPCEWNRYLPSPACNLLTQGQHDAVLSEYFNNITSWQLRVVPRLFLRDMRAVLSIHPGAPHHARATHYSPALHCAVLAEASALAPADCVLAQREIRDALARQARDFAEAECVRNTGTLTTVTALAIIAQYHLATPRGGRLAHAILGMATRVALSAGLNMDVALEDEEKWEREWCYWTLFVQDVDLSLHVGQEFTLPHPYSPISSTIPLPLFSTQDNPFVAETFMQTCALMSLAARMIGLLSPSAPPSASKISALHTDLTKWHADLPDTLQIHRASTSSAPAHVLVMHMAYHWVTILLHRPFYSGPSSREESHKFLDDACTKLLRTLGTFERLYSMRAAPLGLVQITFVGGVAALVRADATAAGAQKRRQEALSLARQACEALRAMGPVWLCAAAYADTLSMRIEAVAHSQGRVGRPTSASASFSHSSPSPGSVVASPTGSGGATMHAHSHSVPAVVVQDENNGASMAVGPTQLVTPSDSASLGFLQMESGEFGAFGSSEYVTSWSSLDPLGANIFDPSAQDFVSQPDAMLGVTTQGLLTNPDAGAGVALFGGQQHQPQFFYQPSPQDQGSPQRHQHHQSWSPQGGWSPQN